MSIPNVISNNPPMGETKKQFGASCKWNFVGLYEMLSAVVFFPLNLLVNKAISVYIGGIFLLGVYD